jgi:hypothetical protein
VLEKISRIQKIIGTRVIGTKRGIQWDRYQITRSQKGLGSREKND